jgi:MFS family permease
MERFRQLQLGLIIAVTLHAFDELVLIIALPTIVKDLGGGDWYGVALSSYVLTSLIGIVWAGGSIDQRGPLRIFMTGYGIFLVGLLIAMLATDIYGFLLARALQGIGGGIGWTVAYSVTNIVMAPDQKPRMIAWLDSAWIIPSLLAPTIGGYLIDYLDWRWIFAGQIPVLVLAGSLLYAHLKPLNKEPGDVQHTNHLVTAIKLSFSAALIVTCLGREIGWQWLGIPLAFIIGWRPLISIMPKEFWLARAGMPAAIVCHFLIFFVFDGAEIFLPLMLIEVRDISSSVSGLAFTCAAITWVAASFIQSSLVERWQYWHSISLGMVLVVIAIAMLSTLLKPTIPFWIVYPAWAVGGFGMGLAFNALTTATMEYTEKGKEGSTSTVVGIAASLGIGLAAGLGGALYNQMHMADYKLEQALGVIWLITGLVGLFTIWLVLLRFRNGPRP